MAGEDETGGTARDIAAPVALLFCWRWLLRLYQSPIFLCVCWRTGFFPGLVVGSWLLGPPSQAMNKETLLQQ